jgi:transcriptional regulator GlxA family with amidase domain
VSAQIWAQVLAGAVSIDNAARALDTSSRSLQRALLANAIRVRRGGELLAGTTASVTEIAVELGYSAPANFARAFRKATGRNPGSFRRNPPGPEGG